MENPVQSPGAPLDGVPRPAVDARIHGLDALRAVLMLLGVVFHTALSYIPGSDSGNWPFSDPLDSTRWLGLVIDGVHIFRMPAFFVLSGFFGALLWSRRGARAMLRNRLERVVLPLAVFAVLLWPVIIFVVRYAAGLVDGEAVPLESALSVKAGELFPPYGPMHLWFLYYLAFIAFITAGGVTLMERFSLAWPWLLRQVRKAVERPVRCVCVFGALNAVCCVSMSWASVPVSAEWRIDPFVLAYYLGCYGVGWMIFASRVDLQSLQLRARTLVAVGLGCVLFRTGVTLLRENFGESWGVPGGLWDALQIAAFTVGLVALARGLTGVFLRYASAGSARWRYISDSSYWVYLLHLPLSMLIPALLVGWRMPVLLKYSLATLLVAGVCLATYDAAVRSTFVGRFLNGRRFGRRAAALSAVASIVALAGMAYGTARVIEPADRLSPWNEGTDPTVLLPDETITRPFAAEDAEPPHRALKNCVKVRDYTICPSRVSFEEAVAACTALGSHLVAPQDRAENEPLKKVVSALTSRAHWLGFSDREEEGTWRLLAGESLEYDAWNSGEPNDYGGEEDCAAANWGQEGNWNDMRCSARLQFVCEG